MISKYNVFLTIAITIFSSMNFYSCDISSNFQQQASASPAASTVPIAGNISVSGTVTGSEYTKIILIPLTNTTVPRYYGLVNASTGNFSLEVPENLGLFKIGAFKDSNANGTFDYSEDYCYENNGNDSRIAGTSAISGINIEAGGAATITVNLSLPAPASFGGQIGVSMVPDAYDGNYFSSTPVRTTYINLNAGDSSASTSFTVSKDKGWTVVASHISSLDQIMFDSKVSGSNSNSSEVIHHIASLNIVEPSI